MHKVIEDLVLKFHHNKKYKTNHKLFKYPMEKIDIILSNVWTHENQVVFKMVQPNSFLVIKKATLILESICAILIVIIKNVKSSK